MPNHKNFLSSFLFILLPFLPTHLSAEELRIAVIGGLEMSGFWSQLESAAEEKLGITITTVLAAPKERVVPAFVEGEADVLLMHGGDETFALEALGYAGALQTWGYNDFVFVGPNSDLAGIAQAASGIEAMLKLQSSGAPLISFRDIASQQIIRRLLDSAGLLPRDINLISDSAGRQQEILLQAQQDQAYVIVGHMPVAFNRMPSDGTTILLQGDPAMRRGYSVLTPGPLHPASAEARKNAGMFADFIVSEEGQAAIETIGGSGERWIYTRESAKDLVIF